MHGPGESEPHAQGGAEPSPADPATFGSASLPEPLDLAARSRMASLRRAMFGVGSEPVRIDRFVLQAVLGAGGMGIVYEAYDARLDRRIALKLVRSDGEGATKDEARLVREAQSMARISHPNVVQIFEVGAWQGRVYIAMELVPGRTLAAWLATRGRGWREIVDVFVEAGRGLDAAHAVGVVHRDFKPENVLVGDDGRVRVTDFGLARGHLSTEPEARSHESNDPLAGLVVATLTTSSAFAGTPAYMAPEQFLGERATAASDQFSFCVALYHALHGIRPFAGADLLALSEAVLHSRLQEPNSSQIPRRVHRALLRGLSTDPARRFPSMQELLAELAPRSRRSSWVVGSAAVGALGLAGALMSRGSLQADRPTAQDASGAAVMAPVCEPSLARFDVANSETAYRVPAGCTAIHVRAWGGGGGGAMYPGGGGGYAEAILRVEPDSELIVAVGGGGGHWANGWIPELTGGSIGGHGGYPGASSGGLSGVREGLTWLLVAGGGGGGGISGGGGGGGGPRGEDGFPYNTSRGHGGTPEAPGAGGYSLGGADPGQDGHGTRGGIGGASPDTKQGDATIGVGGGAGGGGYMAGGGGGGDRLGAWYGGKSGGGGGGSGYVDSSRSLRGSIRLLTASRQNVPLAEEAGGAGRGGDARLPEGAWLAREMTREATSGGPGLVLIATGVDPSTFTTQAP